MYIDLGDGSSMDVLSIQNMQNESAKKAQARGKAMDKLFSGIISTRDELAAKVDAEKKSEEEARAKKVAEEQRQKAEAAAKRQTLRRSVSRQKLSKPQRLLPPRTVQP